MDMFEHQFKEEKLKEAPLAAQMRPKSFNEFVGQEHLVGKGRVLRRAIESSKLPSIILWGPPGSGKTTLAYIIAGVTDSLFNPISAVSAGVADLRRIIDQAREHRMMSHQRTILFIDEIHRFNKAQQDAILPYVEDGTITLIGATTENPSFEVISPLLSRCQVFTLQPLTADDIRIIVLRALKDSLRGLGTYKAELADDAMEHIIAMSNNDARAALNIIEMAVLTTPTDDKMRRYVSLATIEEAIQHRALIYDKSGEQHFNTISALHKSMRSSDPDASIYWLARMLEAGEDPLYIARRLVRFATEDIGMADPQALVLAMATQQAVHFIGIPEGNLALAEAVVYLSMAPKSNSVYQAYSRVQKEIKTGLSESVPLHLRNPVTSLMKDIGYGKDYKYDHDFPGHFVKQENLPDALRGKRFYIPGDQGYEKQVSKRLKNWWQDRGEENML